MVQRNMITLKDGFEVDENIYAQIKKTLSELLASSDNGAFLVNLRQASMHAIGLEGDPFWSDKLFPDQPDNEILSRVKIATMQGEYGHIGERIYSQFFTQSPAPLHIVACCLEEQDGRMRLAEAIVG